MKHFWIPETWMWMWPDGWAARHCMSRTEHQNLAIDYWFVVWCQTLVLLVQSVFLFCWNKSSVHVWCRVSSLKWIRTPEPGGLKLFQSEAEADVLQLCWSKPVVLNTLKPFVCLTRFCWLWHLQLFLRSSFRLTDVSASRRNWSVFKCFISSW